MRQAHLPDGQQVTGTAFGDRLRLERIRFRGEGAAWIDFGHDLYGYDLAVLAVQTSKRRPLGV